MSEKQQVIEGLAKMADGVLRNAVLRAIVTPGSTPLETSAERRAELLGPLEQALASDLVQLTEVIRIAFVEGIQSVHRDLHGQPGIDSEMLEQAIEYHSNRIGKDGYGEPISL